MSSKLGRLERVPLRHIWKSESSDRCRDIAARTRRPAQQAISPSPSSAGAAQASSVPRSSRPLRKRGGESCLFHSRVRAKVRNMTPWSMTLSAQGCSRRSQARKGVHTRPTTMTMEQALSSPLPQRPILTGDRQRQSRARGRGAGGDGWWSGRPVRAATSSPQAELDRTMVQHISAIVLEGEVDESRTCKSFLQVGRRA